MTLNAATSVTASTQSALATWFTSEIRGIMHGMGDGRKPLMESARLIESIVHQQVSVLIIQAASTASKRNCRFIGLEDFLFSLRRDKVKLRRLLRHLMKRDQKVQLEGTLQNDEVMEGIDTSDKHNITGQSVKKRTKIAKEFLSIIDNTGELLELFHDQSLDEVKHERMLRADMQSRSMDQQQYAEFCESRRANFSKICMFKDWLLSGVTLDYKINPYGLEILAYFVLELISQVIDVALIVKKEKSGRTGDSFRSTPFPSSLTVMENSGAHNLPSDNSKPLISPASALSSTAQVIATNTAPKQKSRKRKQSNSTVPPTPDPVLHDVIRPSDIEEAFRRYSLSYSLFAQMQKLPPLPETHWLMCV